MRPWLGPFSVHERDGGSKLLPLKEVIADVLKAEPPKREKPRQTPKGK